MKKYPIETYKQEYVTATLDDKRYPYSSVTVKLEDGMISIIPSTHRVDPFDLMEAIKQLTDYVTNYKVY